MPDPRDSPRLSVFERAGEYVKRIYRWSEHQAPKPHTEPVARLQGPIVGAPTPAEPEIARRQQAFKRWAALHPKAKPAAPALARKPITDISLRLKQVRKSRQSRSAQMIPASRVAPSQFRAR